MFYWVVLIGGLQKLKQMAFSLQKTNKKKWSLTYNWVNRLSKNCFNFKWKSIMWPTTEITLNFPLSLTNLQTGFFLTLGHRTSFFLGHFLYKTSNCKWSLWNCETYVSLLKASSWFCNPGISFSVTWEPTLWNVILKGVSTPISQFLWEGQSLTSMGTLLQVIKFWAYYSFG